MIKAVLFDVGDVLVHIGKKRITYEISKLLKTDLKTTRRKYRKIEKRFQRGEVSEGELWKFLSKRLKVKIPKYTGYLERKFSRRVKRNKDVYAIAKELKKKYNICILSNTIKPHVKVHRRMKHYKMFPIVVLSSEVVMRKPEIKIYRYALKKLGLKAKECLFIDNEEKYLVPAKKLGMKTILFTSAEQLRQDLKKLL